MVAGSCPRYSPFYESWRDSMPRQQEAIGRPVARQRGTEGGAHTVRLIYLEQYLNLPTDVGGGRCFEAAVRLAARGHNVDVVTSDRSPSSAEGWSVREMSGFKVHSLPNAYSNDMSYPRRIAAFVRFAVAAGLYSVKLEGDLVFASSTPLTIAIPAVLAKSRLRVPMVFEVRDLWPEVPIAMGALRNPMLRMAGRWLERVAYRNSERVVALSPGMRDGIVRAGYPRNRVDVIPNCSDVETLRVPEGAGLAWRSRHPEVNTRQMVLYAGTLGRVNGVDWLVRLASVTAESDPSLCFVVVGRGIEEEAVRKAAEREGVLGRNVFLFPAVPRCQLAPLLSAATVVCSVVADIEALWHNSANKVFDGFAAGRPVMINHGGWQKTLLEDSGAGLALPFGDIRRASELLVSFVTDAGRLTAAKAASANLADSRFSRDRLVGALIDVLEAVADRSGRPCRRGK